jgi:hypothetical protein
VESLITGFVLNGNAPKRFLIRGVGPTLADFGVKAPLADPRLEVHTRIDNRNRLVAVNDDWSDEPQVAETSAMVGAFPLREESTDAAIVITLSPGSYTALVTGFGTSIGEALVEVYSLE